MGIADLFGKKSTAMSAADYLNWLKARLSTTEQVLPMKPDTVIRASSIGWLCAREEVVCGRNNVVRTNTTTADGLWTMSLGTGIHYTLQNLFLGPIGEITGRWKCSECGVRIGSIEEPIPMPNHACPTCAKETNPPHELWEYDEQPIFDVDLRLSGHCDGLHPKPTDAWEFKSANTHSMRAIKQGELYDGYVDQAHVYMNILGRRRMRFLFVNKGDDGIRSLFPVMVPFSNSRWDQIKAKIFGMREGLDGGKIPQRICGSRSCTRAKNCSVVDECFALPND